ncbi:unnamed protein product [Ectocarpus sp. 12 AP-2014]
MDTPDLLKLLKQQRVQGKNSAIRIKKKTSATNSKHERNRRYHEGFQRPHYQGRTKAGQIGQATLITHPKQLVKNPKLPPRVTPLPNASCVTYHGPRRAQC